MAINSNDSGITAVTNLGGELVDTEEAQVRKAVENHNPPDNRASVMRPMGVSKPETVEEPMGSQSSPKPKRGKAKIKQASPEESAALIDANNKDLNTRNIR